MVPGGYRHSNNQRSPGEVPQQVNEKTAVEQSLDHNESSKCLWAISNRL